MTIEKARDREGARSRANVNVCGGCGARMGGGVCVRACRCGGDAMGARRRRRRRR